MCSGDCEITEDEASTLRERRFGIVLEHLLSTMEAEVVFKPPRIEVFPEGLSSNKFT